MTKSISETNGTIGSKNANIANKNKDVFDKDIKSALSSAVLLMKDIMNSSEGSRLRLCLDLKRKIEDLEKKYGLSLI